MYSWERKGEYHMTVEELVKILDKEVTFEVLQAYDREIILNYQILAIKTIIKSGKK